MTGRTIIARVGKGVRTLSPRRLDAGARDRLTIVAAFVAVYVVWGSTYLAIAVAVQTIPPFLMIAGRCLLAGGILYAATRRAAGAPSHDEWRRALLSGVLLFVTGQAMLAWAETRVASGATAVLVATEPLFVVLLGWRGGALAGRGRGSPERDARVPAPSGRVVLALVAGFGGVAAMMLPGRLGGVDAVGALAVVVAAFSWSVGVFHATPGTGRSPVQAAGMQLITGGAALVLLSAVMGELSSFEPLDVTRSSWVAFFYLVVFGSLVTYVAYVWLLRRVGPARLSSHAYVNPMVAVALGALLAGEPLTPAVLLSSVLILAAVVVLVRGDG